jgi:hypothetical protein
MQIRKLSKAVPISFMLLLACAGIFAFKNVNDSVSGDAKHPGKDMYYEFSLSSTGKNTSTGTTKLYISANGEMRVEKNITITIAGKSRTTNTVILGHADKPGESIWIDEDKKTYSVNHFTNGDLDMGDKVQSTVTKMGVDKIMGFASVHARIISTMNLGATFSRVDTIDLWRSNDVPMQPAVKALMDQLEYKGGNFLFTKTTVGQLREMGCEGFMTMMKISTKSSTIKEELTKAEHRDIPTTMFQIPSGYKDNGKGF